MKKFIVYADERVFYEIPVEADDAEDAKRKVYEGEYKGQLSKFTTDSQDFLVDEVIEDE